MIKFKRPVPVTASGRLKTIATGCAEIFKLDPRVISREPGFNTRYDFGDLVALTEDIAANGVIDPLKVRKDGAFIWLVNGDRRLTAVSFLIEEGRWPEDPRHPGYLQGNRSITDVRACLTQ
jgi:hypothetical protein